MYADRMNPLRRHPPREAARRLNGLLASIALAVLAVVGLVACGEQAPVPSPTPSTAAPATSTPAVTTPPATPSATPSASATVTVLVYFLRDQRIAAARRDVPATKAVATAAVRALLRGPHAEERAAGLQSALSPGMELVRITIRTRTAFVELTATPDDVPLEAPRLQLAQIVHTVTQFPTVDSVVISFNGEPVSLPGDPSSRGRPLTRADFEEVAPAILVESPTIGETVSSPLLARGTANTFEATFMAEVRDATNRLLVKKVVTATSGSGTRGAFRIRLPFASAQKRGALVVYELSAEDGSVINLVRIPLRLASAP